MYQMEKEIWKEIPVKSGMLFYEASNLGRIRTTLFYKENSRKYRRQKIKAKTSIKSSFICPYGYEKTNIKTLNLVGVHQLVAMAFLNHKPCGYETVVDHIDNNPLNNRLDNLQLVTHRYNVSKSANGISKYTGVSRSANGEKWLCFIRIKGVKTYLGTFDNEIEASNAYNLRLNEINNTTYN